jgi:hypothetical protein
VCDKADEDIGFGFCCKGYFYFFFGLHRDSVIAAFWRIRMDCEP